MCSSATALWDKGVPLYAIHIKEYCSHVRTRHDREKPVARRSSGFAETCPMVSGLNVIRDSRGAHTLYVLHPCIVCPGVLHHLHAMQAQLSTFQGGAQTPDALDDSHAALLTRALGIQRPW